jgi:hypothetical protein
MGVEKEEEEEGVEREEDVGPNVAPSTEGVEEEEEEEKEEEEGVEEKGVDRFQNEEEEGVDESRELPPFLVFFLGVDDSPFQSSPLSFRILARVMASFRLDKPSSSITRFTNAFQRIKGDEAFMSISWQLPEFRRRIHVSLEKKKNRPRVVGFQERKKGGGGFLARGIVLPPFYSLGGKEER